VARLPFGQGARRVQLVLILFLARFSPRRVLGKSLMSLTFWRLLGLAYLCLYVVLSIPPVEAKRAPSPDEINNCHGTTVQWSYDVKAADGPSHWGGLCSEWGLCSEGALQSPVDVLTHTLTPVATSSPLTENYTETLLVNITNSGHTILIDALSPSPSPSSSASNRSINCLFGGPLSGNYVLEQLLFHTPAEHRIDGQSFPVELNLIHRHELQHNSVVIVSILFQLVDGGGGSGSSESSNSNEFLNKLFTSFKKIPSVGNHTTATLPLSSLMPANKYYYHYTGSLSAPPCSEGVEWMILESPLNITASQLASLTTRTHNSSRPLQRLGSRELFQRFAVSKTPSFLTDVGQGLGASIAFVAALIAVVGGGILVQNACAKRLKKAKLKKRLHLHHLSQQAHMDTINTRYRNQHSHLHRSLSSSTSSTSSALSVGGREAHIHGRPEEVQTQMRSGVSPMMASFAPPSPNEGVVKPSQVSSHESTMRFSTNSRQSSRNSSRNNSQKRSRHSSRNNDKTRDGEASSSSASTSSSMLARSPSHAYFSEISSTLREAFHHHQPHHHGHNEDGEAVANPFASPPPLSSATVFVASHEYEPQAYVGDEVYDDDDNPFLRPSGSAGGVSSTVPPSPNLSHSHHSSQSPTVPHMVMAELDSVLTSPVPSYDGEDEDSYVDEAEVEVDINDSDHHTNSVLTTAPSFPSATSSRSISPTLNLHPSSSSSSSSSSTLSSLRPLASSRDEACDVEQGLEEGEQEEQEEEESNPFDDEENVRPRDHEYLISSSHNDYASSERDDLDDLI